MIHSIEKVKSILNELENYIISESYKGYDPFDGLMSPIFKLPILKSNKLMRFGFQQLFRRIPFNLRVLFAIDKGTNPVTLGLAVQAFTYLKQVFEEKESFYQQQIEYCLDKLIELKPKNYSGACWGYDFDWQGRYANITAYTPTIVATGIITNGLFEYYKTTNDKKAKELIISAARFVLNDLNKTYENDTYCVSYSPNDKQMVFNASIKGARLLAQAYTITNNIKYLDEAELIVKFIANNQNSDGSWYYSKGDARKWVDNFHTAYVLDSLREFINLSGYNKYNECLNNGIEFYTNNLFTEEGYPKYYSNSLYPIDATETAQTILTITKFNYIEKAAVVVDFAINNLYSNKGYFYYQKHKRFTNKISFMRWSNAYMLAALSFFLMKSELKENIFD